MKQLEMPKTDPDGRFLLNFAGTSSQNEAAPPHCGRAACGELPATDRIGHQPAIIASVGQTEAQLPQSVHLSGSIQRRPFFSLIASTGHSESQAAQLTQASVTL